MNVPRRHRPLYVLAVVMCVTVGAPRSAAAQVERNGRALAVVAGPFQYDLSGTGTSVFGAARLELPLGAFAVIEPGLTVGRYDAQFGSTVTLLFPEIQLQLQGRGAVSPYLGVGAGPAFAFSEGRSDSEVFLSTALGLRFRARSGWGVRGELRIRAIDPFAGTTAEWGLGISRRL